MTDERVEADGRYHPPSAGQGTDDDGLRERFVASFGSLFATLPICSVGIEETLALAHREYRLASRSRWTLGLTGVFAVVSATVVAAAGTGSGAVRVGAVVVSLAEFSVYLVPLAALAFGYASVVGAGERGTLDMLFALPVSRSRVVLGIFLGRAVALGAAIAVGFGVGGALLVRFAGGVGLAPYATLLLAALGVGLVALATSVLVSTLAREKTHALGAVLLVWVWVVFAHDLVALALVAVFDVPHVVVTALVVANPVDVFRIIVLASVQTTGGGVSAALASSTLSPSFAAVALLGWLLVPIGTAMQLAERAGSR